MYLEVPYSLSTKTSFSMDSGTSMSSAARKAQAPRCQAVQVLNAAGTKHSPREMVKARVATADSTRLLSRGMIRLMDVRSCQGRKVHFMGICTTRRE